MSEFSKVEKDAMRDAKRERKRAKDGDGEQMLSESLEALAEPDQTMAKRVCELIRAAAPNLVGKTFYGMPAFANPGGKVVVFFQSGLKFKTRYCTLGFSDHAMLDDGLMWSTGFALAGLDSKTEARISDLVKQAAS